jgi:hypothetical protein
MHNGEAACQAPPGRTGKSGAARWNPYAAPCGSYLKTVFKDRFDLNMGVSPEVLPRMRRANPMFDLIRSDAGHDFETGQSNLLHSIELVRPDGVILVDAWTGDGSLFILDAIRLSLRHRHSKARPVRSPVEWRWRCPAPGSQVTIAATFSLKSPACPPAGSAPGPH